jgi:hypothetical protein
MTHAQGTPPKIEAGFRAKSEVVNPSAQVPEAILDVGKVRGSIALYLSRHTHVSVLVKRAKVQR